MEILRLVNVHNEEDILKYNLEWYLSQKIKTVAIDNNSTDNSFKILKKYENKGLLEVKKVKSSHFDRKLLFSNLDDLAHKYEPDWVVFADCDEFYEPVDKNFINLRQMVEYVDKKGDNLIQFHNMEFWMTRKEDSSLENPLERIKYYSYFDSNRYKVFKFYSGFSFVPQRGHSPTFPENIKIKLSNKKGISRHYKFRSLEQGKYKINRVVPEPNIPDFGFHYLKYKPYLDFFIIDSDKLNYYNEDKNWCFKKKFDGNRMKEEELIEYLKLSSKEELNDWFKNREGVKSN